MESMFEMKVKDAIKPIEELCDKLVSCTKAQLDKGIEDIDAKEMGEVVDMIKDLSEAKHYIVEAMYKTTIGTAMEENADTYGVEWDEDGKIDRKYYRGQARDSRGRYMSRRGYEEKMMPDPYYRDMDMQDGRMYYASTSPRNDLSPISEMQSDFRAKNSMMGSDNSRYDRARRNYTETKQMGEADTSEQMKFLEKMLNIIQEDVMELAPDMSQSERAMTAQKMDTMSAKIKKM